MDHECRELPFIDSKESGGRETWREHRRVRITGGQQHKDHVESAARFGVTIALTRDYWGLKQRIIAVKKRSLLRKGSFVP